MRVYAPDRRFESDGTCGTTLSTHVVAAALRQLTIVYVYGKGRAHRGATAVLFCIMHDDSLCVCKV